MDANLWMGAGGLLAAVVSAAIAWYFSRRAEVGLGEWLRDLRAWAAECIAVLAEGRALAQASAAEPPLSRERLDCIARLSALVDQGRFFLPNQSGYGPDDLRKPLAYRGLRHAALDPLVAAIGVLSGTSAVPDPGRVLFELQREFVSEVYRVLRPDHHNRRIARLIRGGIRDRERDPSVGGLLPGGETPRGEAAVLRQVVSRIDAEDRLVSRGPPRP